MKAEERVRVVDGRYTVIECILRSFGEYSLFNDRYAGKK